MDSGLYCTHTISRFFGLATNIDQLRRQYVKPEEQATTIDILRIFKSIGLKAKEVNVKHSSLSNIPLPAIAQKSTGEYFILAKKVISHEAEGYLVQEPGSNEVEVKDEQWLKENWNGRLVLVTKRAGFSNSSTAFGFKWFVPALLKYKTILSEVLIASAFIQFFALLTPIFFQVVMDKVMAHKGFTTLDVLAMGLVFVAIFDVILSGLRSYILTHTTSRVDVELGAKLYNHTLALPLAYFQTRRVGDSVARIREVDTIREFITGSALTLTIDLGFTLIIIAVLFLYSPMLTLIVLGAIPFFILLSFLITPVLRKRLNEKFAHGAERQSFLVESISGVETIKSLSIEPDSQRRWEDQSAAYVQASFKANNLNNIANQSAEFISKIMMLGILYFGAHAVIAGDLTIGQFIAFNMLAGRVSGPILKIVHLWQDFQQAGISVKRLGDILNMPTEPKYNPSRTTLPNLKGKVEFDHVSFKYRPDGKEIIKNFSLSVEPGQVIGLVGRSGSGKSTLTKLIQRLYSPATGRVLVDGIDLNMVNTSWLRSQIGVVLQENFLFNRSIRENIAVADPGVPIERVIHAAKLSGAHDFILELEEGYDTLVEEQGVNLSGGQRQRIAIARALINNPSILILDEATSALDYESESIIQRNMKAISHNRTVFIIAHRLSTVRDANHIVVMDKGRIVEQGDHERLIHQKGFYAELWAHQNRKPMVQNRSQQGSAKGKTA
ncbi:type I secretion system permease/ATPase [Hydrogenovibrio kuenenii]|uniref:type I secretion system permease/ATPase n=1 Tax=Hydrogenovibrio kuenenii TaxID=63658 RepID=UPI000463F6E6|nr:type I secretion system permease/ATPase [Hydrogenovibrio kuenenii]